MELTIEQLRQMSFTQVMHIASNEKNNVLAQYLEELLTVATPKGQTLASYKHVTVKHGSRN